MCACWCFSWLSCMLEGWAARAEFETTEMGSCPWVWHWLGSLPPTARAAEATEGGRILLWPVPSLQAGSSQNGGQGSLGQRCSVEKLVLLYLLIWANHPSPYSIVSFPHCLISASSSVCPHPLQSQHQPCGPISHLVFLLSSFCPCCLSLFVLSPFPQISSLLCLHVPVSPFPSRLCSLPILFHFFCLHPQHHSPLSPMCVPISPKSSPSFNHFITHSSVLSGSESIPPSLSSLLPRSCCSLTFVLGLRAVTPAQWAEAVSTRC